MSRTLAATPFRLAFFRAPPGLTGVVILEAGAHLGQDGSSGQASTAHLHFELRRL